MPAKTDVKSAKWLRQWAKIDPETSDFIWRMGRENKLHRNLQSAAREWLDACHEAGLSTARDADLSDTRYRTVLDARLAAATKGIARVRRRHINPVRDGLRFYALALAEGERTRPIPAEAVLAPGEWNISLAAARALLPVEDRRKLEAVDALFLALATKQYAGDGELVERRSDGRRLKMTMSYSTQNDTRVVMDDFIRQGALRDWKPFTLEGLLTPERVAEFLYYSTKVDGTFYAANSIRFRQKAMLDYIYRARVCGRTPIEIVSCEREAELRAAINAEQDNKSKWNKRSRKESNAGKDKWFPNLEEVTLAIAALEENIRRLDDRLAHKRIRRNVYWRKLRDTVLALCTLYGMWRSDTASTLSALHFKRFGAARVPVDANGFAVVVNIARAKNTTGEWYPFVEELPLPPMIVALIVKLLAFEGRTLAQPLRDGEQSVHLSREQGDRWGEDPVLAGELVVVPVFRVAPNDPTGLGYDGVRRVLEQQLRDLWFGATNPHTLRAAGAIYWSFIVGMPEALVMKLGLWEDAKTLRECYARIAGDDQRALMSGFMPSASGSVPRRVHGRRELAAVAALHVLGKMLEKPTAAYEARRFLAELRQHYEAIDESIAAELGKRWEPLRPDRFLTGETERLDEELRALGAGGLEDILGRRIFPREILHELAGQSDGTRALPPAIRSRWQLVTPATRPALTAGAGLKSPEAA